MNRPTITRITNGSITLPKELRKKWRDAEILLMPSADEVYIKRITRPTLQDLEPKLRKLGKLITKKDIDNAVKWARNQIYQTRS